MSTINTTNVQTFDANRTIPVSRIKRGTAIAHVRFWGSGSTIQIKNSYNVNSITYSASGCYIVTLALNVSFSGNIIIVGSSGQLNQDVAVGSGNTPYIPAYPSNQSFHCCLATNTTSNQIYVSNFYTASNVYLNEGMCNLVVLNTTTES